MLVLAAAAVVASAAFRDVSLERRCEVLVEQVKALLDTTGGCAEGNGLGGARYTIDFKLQGHAYRVDLGYKDDGTAQVQLCGTDKAPAVCTADAVKTFKDAHPKASQLLDDLTTWANAKQTQHKIYGMDYDEFVKSLVGWKGGFPVTDKSGKAAVVKFRLEPVAAGNPATGKVRFDGTVADEILQCFKCSDVKCLNETVRYRFDDRFFALTRTLPDGDGDVGAGWVIEGAKPSGDGGRAWSYACGVSRYSLQNL